VMGLASAQTNWLSIALDTILFPIPKETLCVVKVTVQQLLTPAMNGLSYQHGAEDKFVGIDNIWNGLLLWVPLLHPLGAGSLALLKVSQIALFCSVQSKY